MQVAQLLTGTHASDIAKPAASLVYSFHAPNLSCRQCLSCAICAEELAELSSDTISAVSTEYS